MWTNIAIVIAIQKGDTMKTVQMTLDEDLVKAVDGKEAPAGLDREFFRQRLRRASHRS